LRFTGRRRSGENQDAGSHRTGKFTERAMKHSSCAR
jgi:hypothetical protein